MDLGSGTPFETVSITTFGRNRHLLMQLLSEARSAAIAKQEGKTVIYTSWGSEVKILACADLVATFWSS
jgi:chaperone BCS1